MDNSGDTIYVGYLPVPKRYIALLRFVVPVLAGAAVGLSLVLAFTTRSPGQAVWMAEASAHAGILRERPYPFLETTDGPMLLVEPGKFGSINRFKGLEGSAIRVRGTLLERDGWRAIELLGHELINEELEINSIAQEATEVVAIGEILDSKCYLGAMKPGQGRSHRACAILCLRGGIPPLFVGQTAAGEQVAGVLAIENSDALPESLFSLVGERIEIRGPISIENGLSVVRVTEQEVTLAD
ncbi:MAG: hypothetical protein ED559_08420 [Phycisphaera sp.]|nr:MAG: hypothetical protein ED559_08420 [Phycisphaera sp.]